MHTTALPPPDGGQTSTLQNLSGKLLPELRTYITRHRSAVEESVARAERLGGLSASHQYSKLIDGLLCSLFHAAVASLGGIKGAVCLGAVGSFGRRTLSLYSDVDVHLVSDGRDSRIRQLAESLLYPLWDAGLSVGHQLIQPREVTKLAQSDLPTATALLDFRLVAGDTRLAEQLSDMALKGPFSPRALRGFLEQLTRSTVERHERFGDSVFLLEPDVKNGAGGLRDLDVLHWIGRARWRASGLEELFEAGALLAPEAEDLRAARAFLVGIRNRLHLHARRRADRLVFEQQERLAQVLGYGTGGPGVESFMSDYYRHAQTVERVLRSLTARAELPGARKSRPLEVSGGLVVTGDRLGFAEPSALREEPAKALALYQAAVERNCLVEESARQAISGACRDPDFCERLRSSPEAAALFVSLVLSAQDNRFPSGSMLRELNDVGLLLAMIPEFHPVVGRVHHDIYHVYTVDVHSVAAVDRLRALLRGDLAQEFPLACRLAADMARPKILFFSVLLHDIGKDQGGLQHGERGAFLSRTILPRLGFEPEEIEATADLIVRHLRMYHVATRRDVDDPHTLEVFCGEVHNVAGLNELYLLTVVDVSTTSPTAFTPWKRRMLQDLYVAAERWFAGREGVRDEARLGALKREARHHLQQRGCDVAAVEPALQALPERYFYANRPRSVAQHLELVAKADGQPSHISVLDQSDAYVELCVIADDRPGLLSFIAAAFATAKVRVVSAQIYSFEVPGKPARALDMFWVRAGNEAQTVIRTLPKVERIFDRLIKGEAHPVEVVQGDRENKRWSWRPAPPVSTNIFIDNETASRHTVVEVITQDRRDLLFWLSHGLFEEGTTVSLAKLNTEAERVADVFYVTDAGGAKLTTEQCGRVEGRVAQIIHMLAQEAGATA